LQNIELGIAEISKAIFLVDDDPVFYEARGEAYLLLTDYKTAVSNFRRALQVLLSN
jgi:tetratricopeptide (TPR) repeat protein